MFIFQAALHAMDDSAPEDGEMENTDGKDITDRQMAERYYAIFFLLNSKFPNSDLPKFQISFQICGISHSGQEIQYAGRRSRDETAK